MKKLLVFSVYKALGQLSKKESGNQIVLDFASAGLAKGVYTIHIAIPVIGRTEYKKLVYAL